MGRAQAAKPDQAIVNSLEFTVCNPECEMERPGDWIGNDPDFSFLHPDENSGKTLTENEPDGLRGFQGVPPHSRERRDYPFVPPAQAGPLRTSWPAL